MISDLYRPLSRRTAESEAVRARRELRASRAATVVWGIVLTATATTFIGGEQNVLNVALQSLTYFYGGILGAFLLGILSTRGSPCSVAIGMVSGVLVVLHLQLREFLAAPEAAPVAVRAALEVLPRIYTDSVTAWVPRIAWTYWIVAGMTVSIAIGAIGRGRQTG